MMTRLAIASATLLTFVLIAPDHRGEVFGYPGLFVADGSLYPRSPGIGPSMTIAALAERQASLIQ
jgi:choline dehydrogenase-like flavoprotein